MQLFRRWLFHMLLAAGVSVLFALLYLRGGYGVFAARKLVYLPVLIAAVFPVLAFFSNRFLFPIWEGLDRKQRVHGAAVTAAALVVALWLLPPPVPDFPQTHSLIIEAAGQGNPASAGKVVELRDLRYRNRGEIPREAIALTDDWQISEGIFFTDGGSGSRLEIAGEMPAGAVIDLRYGPQGGIVRVTWDGETEVIDLYKRESITFTVVFRARGLGTLPFLPAAGVIALWALYAVGLAALLSGGLLLLYRWTGERMGAIVYRAAFAVVILFFVAAKAAYLSVDQPHAMLDSGTYAMTADLPLRSVDFWTGLRPFTLPILMKLFGIHGSNYGNPAQLALWARFQTILSILSWAVFAFVLSRAVLKSRLSLALFALVLTISLSVDVSLWDALMLSESVSFSLLALLLACWMGWILFLPAPRSQRPRIALAAATVTLTILYVFGRDSNAYFALAAAVLLVIAAFVQPGLAGARRLSIGYAVIVVLAFVAQSAAMNASGRWSIFMHDHLAMRILKNPQATAFFVREGLPLSDELLATTEMQGIEYTPMIREESQFAPLREWIDCCSKGAYARYLLSDLPRTLREPLENAPQLINGSVRGYRNPRYGLMPLPRLLADISRVYFSQKVWVVWLLTAATAVGLIYYALTRRDRAWIIIAVLALPVLPMLYLVWWGEPMEIERHAAQVYLQFRLAGWLSIALTAERLFCFLDRVGRKA